MKTPREPSRLLDRGGEPTVRELISKLSFNPVDGTIRLNGDRIVMQRAAVGVELRRELIRLLGPQEARIFLIRLGFFSGQADARFVRAGWPNLDIGDAFTAGTRLHMFSGVVRVETVHNEFDLRKKQLSAEFLWHDSVEAAEFRRLEQTTREPVCWTQLGYASGYASEFFGTLIVYKEIRCSAQGHPHCRVAGKAADAWGAADADVILFRDRIVSTGESHHSEPSRLVAVHKTERSLPELDRLVLAPVRDELDRIAPTTLPVTIAGSPGTGRSRAARYLHRVSGRPGEMRAVIGARVDFDLCAEIARHVGGRRSAASGTLLIDGLEDIPAPVQPHLARAIEQGLRVGGPRILALGGPDAPFGAQVPLSPELVYALSALTIRMLPLSERRGDIAAIAQTFLPELRGRTGLRDAQLDAQAVQALAGADWPGNLSQLRAVLSGALVAIRDHRPVSRAAIETQLARFSAARPAADNPRIQGLPALLDGMFETGGFSLSEVERAAYETAVSRSGGNLSAAARLLGLTRAQLAYRIGVGTAQARPTGAGN